MKHVEQKRISGFWRRLLALLTDVLLLGLVGFLLGSVLEDLLVEMGSWGRLVGFSVAVVYFGVMNSRVMNGGTIGKKLLKLEVVDGSGGPIGPGRSFARSTVLLAPFFLNGAFPADYGVTPIVIYPLALIMFGGSLSIIYLYVFNRVSRQSLHDLIVGTYVVRAGVSGQETGKVWRPHLVVVLALCVASLAAPALASALVKSEQLDDLMSMQQAVNSISSVSRATVASGTVTHRSGNRKPETRTYISVRAFVADRNPKDADLARRLAEAVAETYPDSRHKDAIEVTLTYGYDIGIWSRWYAYTHGFHPDKL